MDHRYRTRRLALALLAGSAVLAACPVAASPDTPQAAPDPAIAQANALVRQMTGDEKLTLLVNGSAAIPRLGIPAYNWWTEALHGLAGGIAATNFPEPIGLGATFDDTLVHSAASAMSEEVRANFTIKSQRGEAGQVMDGLDVWAPNINIYRDPRWGRGQETYGEDPYLTSRMGVAYITGMQGPDPDHPLVIATPKHFAVHSGPEPVRHAIDVKVSLHDMEDTYLPAFRAAIVEGHAGSIMCAYNSINGQPACANDFLLNTKLRGDWGFKGYVVSDCDALADISEHHKYRPTREAAIGAAFHAGMDNECAMSNGLDNYRKAAATGELAAADIDRALVRLLAARFRLGELPADRAAVQTPAPDLAPDVVGGQISVVTPAHSQLALRAAEESLVLLKNNGILPLVRPDARIALIGPLATQLRVLRGNYSSSHAPQQTSVFAGLRAALPEASIKYVPGGAFVGDADPIPESLLRSTTGAPGLTLSFYASPPPGQGAPPSGPMLAEIAPDAKPITTKAVSDVDVDLFDDVRGLPRLFTAVWRGSFVPPATGVYRLGLRGMIGRLDLDGKTLVSIGGLPGPGKFATVNLEANHAYPIQIASSSIAFPGMPAGVMAVQLVGSRISEHPEEDALAAARDADVTVAVVGLTSDLEGEESAVDLPGFKGGDRTSLDLPADQQRLLEAAKKSGKRLIVVAMNGGALNLAWAKANADAVIEAWYPGEQGGTAVARAITGQFNPAGRLPVTFYGSVTDLSRFDDYAMTNRTYRYFAGKPVYPFGYGLSYTTFAYGPVVIARADGGFVASVEIRNAGRVAGDEVAQLYLTFPNAPGAPRLALRGFQRLHLAPGEARRVTFVLSPRDMSSVRPNGSRTVAAGRYVITIGGGQPGTNAPARQARLRIATEVPVGDH